MFINEIVFRKNTSVVVLTKQPTYMAHLQDNILWYSCNKKYISDIFYKRDKPKEIWKTLDVEHKGYYYIFEGITPKYNWLYKKEVMQDKYDKGIVVIRNNKLKQYSSRDKSQMNTWWDGLFNLKSGEYPTQKPYKLLERIICISTK